MARRGKLRRKRRKKEAENVQRPIRYRKYRMFFLIVCEDEKTEPRYFEQFKALFPPYSLFLKAVGTGRDALGVVEQALKEREALLERSNRPIDFTWAVFDKDDADANDSRRQRFARAFELAKQRQVELAYSNECFELWLLLHFQQVDMKVALPRRDIYEALELAIQAYDPSFAYRHGDSTVVEPVAQYGDEAAAEERAAVMLAFHDNRPVIEANPSTTLHKLVRELRDWGAFYTYKPE
ncbi:MAG: RloB domain-containing protein [Bacteroidetes bacterium]|nr:RloB domain-containing protein [Bacteroidota bacterium]